MSMNDPQPEPTMEEILASIRRIIAEDDEGGEVLDLKQEASFDEPPAAPAASAARARPAPAPAPAADADLADDLLVFDEEPEEPAAPLAAFEAPAAPPAAAQPVRSGAAPTDESILSEQVATATASALMRLAGSLRIADTQGQSLEGLVRELLKPMLKEWLDANLKTIVEAKVEEAIERVMRHAR